MCSKGGFDSTDDFDLIGFEILVDIVVFSKSEIGDDVVSVH